MKNKIIFLMMLSLISFNGWSQNSNIKGKVIDKKGEPMSGLLVSVKNFPGIKVTTDKNGIFEISVPSDNEIQIQASNFRKKVVPTTSDSLMIIVMDDSTDPVDVGFGIVQTKEESAFAVSYTPIEQVNRRSSFSIYNSLFGNVLGLTALQRSGAVWENDPALYIRGLQTLSNNNILVLVDGLERNIRYITPEEVESVHVLRDAAAVALYGYRGINGILSISTKRGKYKTREINVNYDHAFNWQVRLPKFADSYMYANALNEALVNDGKSPRYSKNELNALKNGTYPYYYPNVNWVDEVFRDYGASNIYTVNFRGGSLNARYFTMLNLQSNSGFINNAEVNEGYSTQMKFSKGNIRTNLDIDLTPATILQMNLMGVLNEFSRPGLASDNLMVKLYTVPSAAFPIKTADGIWGGNETWGSNMNPVALTQARGYSKGHTRSLYADMKLTQKLDFWLNGLSASLRVGYDNIAAYWEGHIKDYAYACDIVTSWENGEPTEIIRYKGGADSELGFDSKLDWQDRHFNLIGNIDYQKELDKHHFLTSLIYSYENHVKNGQHNTYFRSNIAAYGHYIYNKRYIGDLTLVASASNKLAPGEKWHFSPTISAAWLISQEDFMKHIDWIDFMKLRASLGIINGDNIPEEHYWEQSFYDGGGYPLGGNYDGYGGTMEGRLPSFNTTCEKAFKYNFGLDFSVLKSLSIATDVYYEKRKDIWVSASGKNSAVLGVSSPYVNAGIVDSWGIETGLNYSKKFREFMLTVGGNFTLSKNKIIEQLEEPRAYDYLRRTGKPINQIFGLQAIGFFIDQGDIEHSPVQQFSEVKPGDIKYKDQNEDGIINEFDRVAMGYNTSVPEIYYSFDLGFEWKGLGLSATFQGVANYTAILNTQSVYWPLINNTTISEHYYNNRWIPENPFAKYPRLTTERNDNNFQTNSVWLSDASFLKLRNCELYYKISTLFLSKSGIKSAKIYLRGVDLFSWDKIKLSDPESTGATWPMTSSINVGLALSF